MLIYPDYPAFNWIVYIWILVALTIPPVLSKITAPYGRHARRGWGPQINNTLGWVLMEIVSPLALTALFFSSNADKSLVNWLLYGAWLLHYVNRSIIFPMRYPNKKKQMPLVIALSAIFFNSVNGGINGFFLGTVQPHYPESWLTDPRFIIGAVMFVAGFVINNWSDNILLHLRKPGETGYKIPRGGLFRYVSAPNYFGELIEWGGFALAAWNLPALTFLIWTAVNLVPRAYSNHQWYLKKFDDYPKERKALIPFLW